MTRRVVIVLVGMALAVALAIGVAVIVISSNSDKATLAGKKAVSAAVLARRIDRLQVATRRDSAETHAALCALRADLKRRVDGSIKFLAEHPKGIPGIPARVIRDGVDNQQRTITTLGKLNCP